MVFRVATGCSPRRFCLLKTFPVEFSTVIVEVYTHPFIDAADDACFSWLQLEQVKRRPRPTNRVLVRLEGYSISNLERIVFLVASQCGSYWGGSDGGKTGKPGREERHPIDKSKHEGN
jgi:hypothetical protein